ncbi:MAG: PaaI family thioesterase [Acidimicrobiales bacterium]
MGDNSIDGPPQANDVHGLLGVKIVEATPDKVVMSIDVGPKVFQPYGILHGGVSALLAESAASFGGALNIESGQLVVGTELNCSHLRSMSSGTLTATATPIRTGRRVQVWGIDLTDDEGRKICVARCTLQVLEAPAAG